MRRVGELFAADPALDWLIGRCRIIDAAGLEIRRGVTRYKNALPKVAYRGLQDIFSSASTLWLDKEVMIPSYQDSVGDGSQTPIGARANSEGAGSSGM